VIRVFSVPETGSPQQSASPNRSFRLAEAAAPRQVVDLVVAALDWWRYCDATGARLRGHRYIPGSAPMERLTRILRADTRVLHDQLTAARVPAVPVKAVGTTRRWVSL
jgi:hypothetical protein